MLPHEVQRAHGDPVSIGPYPVRGRLGRGGQGVVYLADDEDGEPVAVKVLAIDWDAAPDELRAQVRAELTAARKVAPFCTARVLASDVDANPPYIVSEYIEGPSLQDRVQRTGPLSGSTLERLAVGTATALSAIHVAGVVHRDFKPSNVMLGADGPRVIDFGIARALDVTATLTGRAFGTPGYMAPEQFSGEPVGPAADIFAWGVTMLFAGTGAPPFPGDSPMAVMQRVLHDEPDVSGLPRRLAEVVRDCLEKDPTRRPAAQDVLFRLLAHAAPAARTLPLEGRLREGAAVAAAAPPTRGLERPHHPLTDPDRYRDVPTVRSLGLVDDLSPQRWTFFAACRARERGRWDRAEKLYRTAMTATTGYWPAAAAIELGNMLREAGVPGGAAECYDAAWRRNRPELNALALLNAARLRLELRHHSDALGWYRAAESTRDRRYAAVAVRERQLIESGHLRAAAEGGRLLPGLPTPRAHSLYVVTLLLVLFLGLAVPVLGGAIGLVVAGLGAASVRRNRPALTGRWWFAGGGVAAAFLLVGGLVGS